ncbi:chromate transporter [Cytobacillus oceanisediminis]|uniref:Chromate transporter n=1 Tax=Cytobacillus oceanisediminis TaxID=665099 RepID=A0A562K3G7_9BACI|nr:chromate transporter [Cytobacillus oceanisediminis]TWH89765.1 chromate transporter [Cytobacillus oceanisediminis]
MIYVQIFLAFFIPGILGYGGGPASIPLVENEVVDNYEWLTVNEFSEVLAMGNALPGPIATKMAGYIGFQQAGVLGAIVGVFATVAPSLILMITLLGLLMKYKESPRVKRMTTYIRPVIAVLLGIMTYDFFFSAYEGVGIWQTLFIGLLSFFLMEKLKVHPAYVIAGALVYGGLVLA